jgi:HSP20 family protein
MVRFRTNGLPPFAGWRDEMERLMGDFLGNLPGTFPRAFAATAAFPAVNVWEDTNNLYAEAELPGVKSEDLDIAVMGNELTIKGKRPEQDADETAYHRRERGAGEFTRVLRLPVEVSAEGVQAALRDGVLSLTLPKAPSARPRKIEVSAVK